VFSVVKLLESDNQEWREFGAGPRFPLIGIGIGDSPMGVKFGFFGMSGFFEEFPRILYIPKKPRLKCLVCERILVSRVFPGI
jgi:hypothetical protein